MLAVVGSYMLLRTLDAVETGSIQLQQQDDAGASPAPKIFRETCHIPWEKPAKQVHDFIRGLSPFPKAWTMHHDTILKITRSVIADPEMQTIPGTVFASKETLRIACGEGAVEISELQQEGRKMMSTADFLRGYPLRDGEIFW